MILDLTQAALEDLQSIRDYTFENWGENQEQIYLESMWSRLEEILSDPERYRHRDDLFPGCQIAAHGKHVILFRIHGKSIQVARILHSAMDFKRHIKK